MIIVEHNSSGPSCNLAFDTIRVKYTYYYGAVKTYGCQNLYARTMAV